MNFAGVMLFGIASALLAVLLGQIKGEYSVYIILAAGIFLFVFIAPSNTTICIFPAPDVLSPQSRPHSGRHTIDSGR